MTTNPASQPTPASANFEKLKAKLRELFELDKADLDFGIYRVLRARHKEIAEFLDKHLEKTVREALQTHGSLHQSHVEEDLRKAEQAAKEAGIAPEQSPRVLELREKLKAGNELDALADEVYSHLYTFFSRYYQEGDFLGLSRATVKGREKYMIPYNGEEVKLVWANMDQYYIKSSELLRDYTFQVTPGEGTLLEAATNERYTIHFKLVEADTEKDNRKPSGKTTRAFALDEERPFEISREDAKSAKDQDEILTIRFRYREHTAERNLQDKLNADTERTLADNLPAKWKAVLFAPDPGYQGKDKKDTRTILQKHLRAYTAKYQFDYFIHKDLGGFLRRELDFYIKNEVMYLDDIEETSAPKAEEYLSKIRAIRRCALPIIQMLEQLENFQKKLWLKKKFVVETRYCVTLDRVPESLYPEICANDAQWEEWERLYALSELFVAREDAKNSKESQEGLFRGFAPSRDPELLKANPYMMVDTRHFGREFTLKLLASVENLDESLDGVCFHSENFQALQLMQERYREQVRCVYIDPPYNTPYSRIIYKNNFLHSTWLALLSQTLPLVPPLWKEPSSFGFAIDDFEQANLASLLDGTFPSLERSTIVVNHHPQGAGGRVSRTHEYYMVLSSPDAPPLEGEPREDVEEDRNFMRSGTGENNYRYGRWRSFYALLLDPNTGKIVDAEEPPAVDATYPTGPTESGLERIYPINSRGEERVWRASYETGKKRAQAGEIERTERGAIYQRLDHSGKRETLFSNWTDSIFNAGTQGTNVLSDLGLGGEFDYPKSLFTITTGLWAQTFNDNEATVLDYFGGSGTTGHAVIHMNRIHKGKRKYVLVEMGAYFDSVLVPRLKKVVYSTDWKDGKPQNRNTGISHAFKIVRLESYEDALNNLRLKRTSEQEVALENAPEKVRDQYLLGYFLDVESAGSASLLDLDQFRDPFAYKLKIATSTVGETKETVVDLVETFNWLLGLKVKHIDAQKGFLTVTGEKRAGGRTLVIWRTLSNDPIADNKTLEAFLGKIKVNPADTEFDYLYVNGSHTLNDPHNKVHLIEEAFQRMMFDTPDFGMEA
jgi:adenine-specific DNA-methyltransferase